LLLVSGMFPPLLLAAALCAAPADPVRRELDGVAARIEVLKARRMAGDKVGPELERLLVRAQELASRLERQLPRPAEALPAPPGPDELRERADALKDEADRLTRALELLDAEVATARSAVPFTTVAARPLSAARIPGSAQEAEPPAVQALLDQRAQLQARIEALRAAAAALELEARALDAER
jgi:hypothetical protein